MRRLRIDPDQCSGDKVCVTIAPYIFAMNKGRLTWWTKKERTRRLSNTPKGNAHLLYSYNLLQTLLLPRPWLEVELPLAAGAPAYHPYKILL